MKQKVHLKVVLSGKMSGFLSVFAALAFSEQRRVLVKRKARIYKKARFNGACCNSVKMNKLAAALAL
jgi:hypothetical protein